MREIELILSLVVVVATLAALARKLDIPYPILLVLGGLGLGFVPGLPRVELEPDIVLLLFLPPILFSAAFFTSIRDFKANAYPIGMLAVGLVLATMAAVAVVAHALVPALGWAAAFALGAIVAPPDAIAATAVAQKLGVPRRLVTILEGESLVNDATALVAYRVAVAAALTGAFSPSETGLRFLFVAVAGLLIGLLVGWAVIRIWTRLDDPPVEVTVSLVAPYAAYLPAEVAGASGVLAAVAAGLYVGRQAARAITSEARVQGRHVWEMLLFMVNGLVFLLIGLQLPGILGHLAGRPPEVLLGLGLVVSLVVIAVRFLWLFPATYLPRLLSRRYRERDPAPPGQWAVVLSWAGMRGAVSLAAALALPRELPGGAPFPERDLLIFLTFCVILATLVVQGLTLPWLIRALGVGDDGSVEHEEAHARVGAASAAVARIEELARQWPAHAELIDQLRAQYAHRAQHAADHHDAGEQNGVVVNQELLEHRMIRHAVIEAEREAVILMRDRGAISDEVMRRVERELDFEELRMEA